MLSDVLNNNACNVVHVEVNQIILQIGYVRFNCQSSEKIHDKYWKIPYLKQCSNAYLVRNSHISLTNQIII